MEKCIMCGKGKLVKKRVRNIVFGVDLGSCKAEVCDKCGETYFDEKVIKETEKKAKELGIWGLRDRVKVHKAGGSFSVVISKKLADFLDIKPNEEVIIYPEGKKKLAIEVA